MSRPLLVPDVQPLRRALILVAVILAAAAPARAQDSLGDAILALWNSVPDGTNRVVNAALFGAKVHIIVDGGGRMLDPKKLDDNDTVTEFSITRGGQLLSFDEHDRSGKNFKRWVKNHADALVHAYLFPTSISESVSGKDAAQNQAQQFLLNTAIAVAAARETGRQTRAGTGGLFEVENLSSSDTALGISRSTLAFQGLYRIQGAHLSVTGRYSQQLEDTTERTPSTLTRSLSLATDFHPSVVINDSLDLRIGIDARSGVLITRASTLSFGSIDYGGGVWTSARKDFSRVRIGVGSLLQASKSYVPGSYGGEDLQMLATTINRSAIAWDVSYGGIAGYAITSQTSLNGKVLQTVPLQNVALRPATTIVMGSVSHLVGGLTPVDIGYKYSTSGGMRSNGVFIQGNYGW
jgi:hypothetical protein